MYRKKFIDKLRTKYQTGGHKNIVPPNVNIPIPADQGVFKPTDLSLKNRMWQLANRITNFTLSPDAKPGLPSQLLAEFTGIPSALRIPTSSTKAYKNPTPMNLLHVATDAAGILGGGAIARGTLKGASNLGKIISVADEAALPVNIAKSTRLSNIGRTTQGGLEGVHNAEVTYKNITDTDSSTIPKLASITDAKKLAEVIPPTMTDFTQYLPTSVAESTGRNITPPPVLLQKGGMYNEPNLFQGSGVRKYGEGGPNEHMDLLISQGGTWEDHQRESHHQEGNTGGGYDYFDSSTWDQGGAGAPSTMEWGAGWNMGGTPGLGIKTPYGSIGMDYPKTWQEGLDMATGQFGGSYGIAKKAIPGLGKLEAKGISAGKKAWNKVKSWFEDGGVRHQTGGMYDQMRQYQRGGMQLPGGNMQPIPGSDAVEFTGAGHDEGGIMLDPRTEVENGETMDQVTMAKKGGKKKDYFFSSYLKKGGRSFADIHKDILQNGGSQEDINMLAKMQEVAANRDSSKIQTAKLGGIAKYQTGGGGSSSTGGQGYIAPPNYEIIEDEDFTIDPSDLSSGTEAEAEAFLNNYFKSDEDKELDRLQELYPKIKRENLKEHHTKVTANVEGEKTITKAEVKEVEEEKVKKVPPAETYESPFATKEEEIAFQDWANTPIAEGGPGLDTKGRGWGPASQAIYDQYASDYETALANAATEEAVTEDVVPVEEVVETEAENVARERQERVDARRPPEADIHQRIYDNLHQRVIDGRELNEQEQADYDAAVAFLGEGRMTTAQRNANKSLYDQMQEQAARQGDVPGAAYLAGAAQLAPAVYAMTHKQPAAEQSVYTPGFTKPIIAERGKASDLERVNYNAERATNAAEMRGINKFIETSGGGPANIINKMSAYARKQAGDMKITAAETRANVDIANREAQLEQQMEVSNLQRAQQASMTNAQLSRAETARMDQIDQLNAAARQKLKDDQEAMKYQGWGLAAQGIAGIAGDIMSYKGQERLARAYGTEGIYERDRLRNTFNNQNLSIPGICGGDTGIPCTNAHLNTFITQYKK